jgi:hypothetical protein
MPLLFSIGFDPLATARGTETSMSIHPNYAEQFATAVRKNGTSGW